MALQKDKRLYTDVDCEYHRIIQLNSNFDRLDAVCTVGTYVNKAASYVDGLSGKRKPPIESFQIDLAGQFHNKNYVDGDDAMKNISLKEAYKALKVMAAEEEADDALAFFADAVDV